MTRSRFQGQELCCVRGSRPVFTGLSFRVSPGEALVLVGPNGSGKSSLLRIMAGLLLPVAGTIGWRQDRKSPLLPVHTFPVHYVGHAIPVKPTLSVLENLLFWAGFYGQKPLEKEKVLMGLDFFGIRHLIHVPGRFLSAGQKRCINLVRLLLTPASLWLVDEPLTALDRRATACLEHVCNRHQKAGGIIIASTHLSFNLENSHTLYMETLQTEKNLAPCVMTSASSSLPHPRETSETRETSEKSTLDK